MRFEVLLDDCVRPADSERVNSSTIKEVKNQRRRWSMHPRSPLRRRRFQGEKCLSGLLSIIATPGCIHEVPLRDVVRPQS